MSISEETMRYLEEHIPELAGAAVTAAYWQALAAGSRVLAHENGSLVEISPDGTRRVIRALPPSIPVTIGERVDIP